MNFRRNTMIAFIAIVLSLTACSKTESPIATGVDATVSRNDLATRAGAPLFDGMGNHHHQITSCLIYIEALVCILI